MHLRTAWRGPARRLCPTQPSIYIGRLEVRIFHRTLRRTGRKTGFSWFLVDLVLVFHIYCPAHGRTPVTGVLSQDSTLYIYRKVRGRNFPSGGHFLWNTEEGDHHKERKGRKGEGAWQKDGVRKMRSQEPPSAERGANKHFISRYMGFQNVRSLPQIVRSSLHGRRFNEEISADCTSAATVEGAWQKRGSKK